MLMNEKKTLGAPKKQDILVNTHNRVHPNCFVCSQDNYRGLQLDFVVSNDFSITAMFKFDEAFEGYPGIVHGGILSSIMDGAMGHCIFAKGHTPVTVEMVTRFRHPVVTGKKAMVSARINKSSHPMYVLESEIIQDGQIKATAK
jgi:acyl-coenzyme A thioesterase PaaI-like protein